MKLGLLINSAPQHPCKVWQGVLISPPKEQNRRSKRLEFPLTHTDGGQWGPQAEHPWIWSWGITWSIITTGCQM